MLRPNFLSIYKDQNEDKLRHKIPLSDLTTVAFLKDPKQKRQNVFGLFTPSRNYHLEATTRQDANEWLDLIRKEARIEEEEEEMLLASPTGNQTTSFPGFERAMQLRNEQKRLHDERVGSSSPEPSDPIPVAKRTEAPSLAATRRVSHTIEYSGNEIASHSDMSDLEVSHARGNSHTSAFEESLAVQSPNTISNARNMSQQTFSPSSAEDPERVVWQGYLLYLKTKGGVRQWKDCWAVVRPKNIALYKNEEEYSPRLIIGMGSVINAVEVDPISRTKRLCLQVITEEKSYKFCARSEEQLDKSLGAIKSLLARRKEFGR